MIAFSCCHFVLNHEKYVISDYLFSIFIFVVMCSNLFSCSLDLVRVYDGNEAVKRRQYRIVSIPKHAPVQVLLVRIIDCILRWLFCIIRPHHMHSVHKMHIYCYRWSSMVCMSVWPSVGHICEAFKNWLRCRLGTDSSKEPCIRGGQQEIIEWIHLQLREVTSQRFGHIWVSCTKMVDW